MNLQEILILADELIFTSTGKHLDNLQQEVLTGILEGKRYGNIANKNEYSEGYIRDLASQLWQILSKELGENINKSNFKSTIERIYNDKYSTIIGDNNKNINFCQYDSTNSTEKLAQETKLSETKSFEYLHKIPKQKFFYGRKTELENLEAIISKQECKLLTIYGVKGIGKTALTVKLVEQIKDNYQSVLWLNLEYFASLKELINYLIEAGTNLDKKTANNYTKTTIVSKLKILLQKLAQQKNLIILDNLASIFEPEKLAGSYQQNYQYFPLFIKAIIENHHQSCVILLTQELSSDLENLAHLQEDNCQLFKVNGLGQDANYLLTNEKLKDSNNYQQLIEIYQGNPLYLKLISRTIQKYFQGKLSNFLEHKQPFIEDNLRSVLAEKLDLLTNKEKEILTVFSQDKQSIILEELQIITKMPMTELIINLQSLERRLLVEIKHNKNITYLTIDSLYHSLLAIAS